MGVQERMGRSIFGRELQAAIAAAREAGNYLRAEFHRDGGPVGMGGHAEADKAAEVPLRAFLLKEFPGDGYRGEETGPDKPGKRIWCVDINDGTRSFLKGYRGSAVSIALICGSKPVLGVVHAFSGPNDLGDLFAWAEGMPTIMRNGIPVVRQPWAREALADATVVLSQKGDTYIRENTMLVAPMRFRAVPSIAWRLALVAAGEGEVGVSLNGPIDWDYAGGHALLRGVGGDFVDARGMPITYGDGGRSNCGGRCFGGSPHLVGKIAGLHWDAVGSWKKPAIDAPELCRPIREMAFPDGAVLERAQGCLLGQLAGDSLGGLVEFKTAAEIQRLHPSGLRQLADGGQWSILAGQPTDDSELALALARSIVRHGRFDATDVARGYVAWLDSRPFDIGSTTRAGLNACREALRKGVDPVAQVGRHGVHKPSNGSLMRVSPLGIFGALLKTNPDALAEMARQDAGLTHPDPLCGDCGAVFVDAIAYAIANPSVASEDVYRHARERAETLPVAPAVVDALEKAQRSMPEDIDCHETGSVLKAFQAAFYQLIHASSLENGVVDTVMAGGDTDTNAAITGALLGAVHGYAAVPAQWRDRVLSCRPIDGLPGVQKPRPPAYWPVDGLLLAERLLLAGKEAARLLGSRPSLWGGLMEGVKAPVIRAEVLDSMEVEGPDGPHAIEVVHGNLLDGDLAKPRDLLVMFCYPNSYEPVLGSLVASLQARGVSMARLAADKGRDFRPRLPCWLSAELPRGLVPYRRILCFEPPGRKKAASLVHDLFSSIMSMMEEQISIGSVAMSILATGGGRAEAVPEMVHRMTEAACDLLSAGVPVRLLQIVSNDEEKALRMAGAFGVTKLLPRKQPRRREAEFDLFLSYCQRDKEAVDEFHAEILRQDPSVRVFKDRSILKHGDLWMAKVFSSIDRSRCIVPFFTPNYLESKVCMMEFQCGVLRKMSERAALLPVYLESARLPTQMQIFQYQDCCESDPRKYPAAVRNILELIRTCSR